ncbi:hypothetical protein KSP39_PZI002786 [Platanthera zijinensis]|uniref:FHA domain-containing protein n=1 Tax=Platanthera zijinensis TaxID=2320716 RepID=A0AAP0BZL1_9ASPA
MAVEISGDRPREPSARELSGSSSSIPKPALNPQDEMRAVARTYSDQPLPNSEPGVWAVLTAISKIARLRPQGVNMLLIEDEHTIGRCVEDPRFHIKSNAISAFHCKIFRESGAPTDDGKADSNIPMAVFLRDTSTNGTYHNWVKLRKRSSKARLIHGDIISFVLPPHDENSYAFVYREIQNNSISSAISVNLERAATAHFGNESKRLKGIGIGAPDGPISLDDVRCLQRSNMELRQQLEFHVVTIEDLRKENKLMDGHHENVVTGTPTDDWIRNDGRVRTWILNSLDSESYRLAMYHETAKGMWDELHTLYSEKDSLHHLYDIITALQALDSSGATDLTSLVAQARSLIEAWIQHQPPTVDLAAQRAQKEAVGIAMMMTRLPHHLHSVRSHILSSTVTPSFSDVCSMLLKVTPPLEVSGPPSPALVQQVPAPLLPLPSSVRGGRTDSRGHGRGGRPRPKCSFCGKDGHLEATCYRKHGRPPRPQASAATTDASPTRTDLDEEALQHSGWRAAMEEEMTALWANQTWTLVPLPPGQHPLKEQKEALSNSYQDRIKDLLNLVDAKQKELDDTNATSAELQNSIKDLNERHNASLQSRSDADEIINSQKATISELEAQLDEERNQRREEWEKAEMDLKSAIQRAHLEAQEEIKRQADVYLRQHREQQEFITKLQESEKESRLLVEMQRSKLEDARESLVTSEKKFRLLEAQFQDEVLASVNSKKKLDAVESEVRKLKKELENEKAAREEAWAKVSSLELEIAAAIRDLSTEKQRFQGARERIILRETQLRAFYSTTEEISSLFSKQQEQLKAMQKTLEDEENYENSLFAIDPTTTFPDRNASAAQTPRESTGVSTPRNSFAKNSDADDMDDDADNCSTQKHDCPNGTHDGHTQDLEGGSPDVLARGFGSDINGEGTATVPDFEPMDTERIVGTESQAGDFVSDERNATLVKCSNMDGETARIDDEVGAQDSDEPREGDSNSKTSPRSRKEDDEASTIRTADLPASEAAGSWALDLLASEAVGSWALDTAPSVYGENESLEDHGAGTCRVLASDGQEAGSQSNTACGTAKLTKEQRELSAMIQIVEPNFKQKFYSRRMQRSESPSDAETEDRSGCSSSGAGGVDSGGDSGEEANATTDADVMIEDSVG